MSVGEGESVALVGPSGAGKSTLLRALLGAVPAAGTVRVGGLDPYGPPRQVRAIRRHSGFVRQGDDLVGGMSARLNALAGTCPAWGVGDWLRALAGCVPPAHAERLATLAARHGVAACLPGRAVELSGGQRRRVALVRALLPAPRLLLADELTGGLDPATAAAAVDAVFEAGVTLIVATHDLAVARRFPRVLALRAGRLVYDGPGLDDTQAAAVYSPAAGVPGGWG